MRLVIQSFMVSCSRYGSEFEITLPRIKVAPEAVVAHVPESGRKPFLAKCLEMLGSVRIVRKYPKA